MSARRVNSGFPLAHCLDSSKRRCLPGTCPVCYAMSSSFKLTANTPGGRCTRIPDLIRTHPGNWGATQDGVQARLLERIDLERLIAEAGKGRINHRHVRD